MNWLKKASVSAVLAAMVLCFVACGDEDTTDPGTQPTVTGTTAGSLADYLANDPRFKVLATALELSGQLSQLDNLTQNFTVFAPVDAAFNALPNSFMSTTNFVSTGDRAKLKISLENAGLGTLLLAHAVTDNESYASVASIAEALTTAANSTISVSMVDPTPANASPSTLNDSFPIVNGRARVLEENVTVRNGRIHVIDTVLIPTAELAQAGEIDADAFPGTLFQLLEATPLFRPLMQLLRDGGEFGVLAALDSTTPFTLFVPAANLGSVSSASDTAYLHTVQGVVNAADLGSEVQNIRLARLAVTQDQDDTLIQGTKIVAADLQASNGVIHVTEGVLPFPASSPADIITTRGELTTFATLLNSVSIDASTTYLDSLRSDQTKTIFAPSNSALAAFDALMVDLNADNLIGDDVNGDGAIGQDDQGNPETAGMVGELKTVANLENLLLYHLTLDGNAQSLDAPASVLTALKDATSQSLTIEASVIGAHRVLNGVIEIQQTIAVGNSYVHIIGNVLVPDDATLVKLTPPDMEFPGTTAAALGYFTLFSGYASIAGASPVGIKMQAEGAAFAGSLMDVFALDVANPALLVPDDQKVYDGQLVDPYAIDTVGDGAVDTNFAIPYDDDGLPATPAVTTTTTTAFVPVNSALPANVDQYLFDLGIAGYSGGEITPYHVVPSTLKAADLTTNSFDSLAVDDTGAIGKYSIAIDTTSGVSLNGQATVKTADLVTKNGVIHVIDAVINP